jgi:hypothetical protein
MHKQLTAQLFILAYEPGVFLFELADAQSWWWERRDLFGRERKLPGRLELRHGLLELYVSTNPWDGKSNGRVPYYVWEVRYLLDVSLSFCAMPRLGGLGLCIATALRPVRVTGSPRIGCCLCHGVLQVEKQGTR